MGDAAQLIEQGRTRDSAFARAVREITCRKYTEDDYPMARAWWAGHNKAYLERELLSPLGLVAERNGKPIMMGWMFLSNASIAQFGWMVSDPQASAASKVAAASSMLLEASALSASLGYRTLQMLSDSSALTKVANACGFRTLQKHDFLLKVVGVPNDDV